MPDYPARQAWQAIAQRQRAVIAATYNLVWRARAELAAAWPTPPAADARLFAFSEAGEVADAWLRLNRPQYNRNHARTPDLAGELADTAIMLLTALGDDPTPAYLAGPNIADDPARLLQDLLQAVGLAQRGPSSNVKSYLWQALYACAALVPDLDVQVARRLDRIRIRINQEQRYE